MCVSGFLVAIFKWKKKASKAHAKHVKFKGEQLKTDNFF